MSDSDLTDFRREFSDAVIPRIKLYVGTSTPQHPNIAVVCQGLSTAAGVLLSAKDGRGLALAILGACAKKDKELGRPLDLKAEAAIVLLRKTATTEQSKPQNIERCPDCGASIRAKEMGEGGGVACTECSWWFCY